MERRVVSPWGDRRLASYGVRYVRAGLDVGNEFTRYGELGFSVLIHQGSQSPVKAQAAKTTIGKAVGRWPTIHALC